MTHNGTAQINSRQSPDDDLSPTVVVKVPIVSGRAGGRYEDPITLVDQFGRFAGAVI